MNTPLPTMSAIPSFNTVRGPWRRPSSGRQPFSQMTHESAQESIKALLQAHWTPGVKISKGAQHLSAEYMRLFVLGAGAVDALR